MMGADTKRCSKCNTAKPVDAFHKDRRKPDGLHLWCKDCQRVNSKTQPQTLIKTIRNRARQRAFVELAKRHDHEFRTLLEEYRVEAAREAVDLDQHPDAAAHYAPVGEHVRLKSGRRLDGQKAGDRIDVARCPHCVKHHDRGHVCAKCGAKPNHALTRPDDGVIDEVAIERAMHGETVHLTSKEREQAVRLMADRGRTKTEISRVLGMSGMRVDQILESESAAS